MDLHREKADQLGGGGARAYGPKRRCTDQVGGDGSGVYKVIGLLGVVPPGIVPIFDLLVGGETNLVHYVQRLGMDRTGGIVIAAEADHNQLLPKKGCCDHVICGDLTAGKTYIQLLPVNKVKDFPRMVAVDLQHYVFTAAGKVIVKVGKEMRIEAVCAANEQRHAIIGVANGEGIAPKGRPLLRYGDKLFTPVR